MRLSSITLEDSRITILRSVYIEANQITNGGGGLKSAMPLQ